MHGTFLFSTSSSLSPSREKGLTGAPLPLTLCCCCHHPAAATSAAVCSTKCSGISNVSACTTLQAATQMHCTECNQAAAAAKLACMTEQLSQTLIASWCSAKARCGSVVVRYEISGEYILHCCPSRKHQTTGTSHCQRLSPTA